MSTVVLYIEISCSMAPCKRIVFVEAFANDDLCISCIVLSHCFKKISQKVSETSQVSATPSLKMDFPKLHGRFSTLSERVRGATPVLRNRGSSKTAVWEKMPIADKWGTNGFTKGTNKFLML